MAQRHAYSQPIQGYGLAPHNRNIWPSPTPTANQYKHMAQRRIIETYGHTIARRRRHAWPILLFWCPRSTHYSYDNNGRCPRQKFVFGILQLALTRFPNLTRAYGNNGRRPRQKFIIGLLDYTVQHVERGCLLDSIITGLA